MRILLVGPPGAGKHTQGAIIARHFGLPHISTGDLLRRRVDATSPVGRAVSALLARGDLVPDTLVMEVVRGAFVDARANGTDGYVLDGMPRTLAQAQAAFRIGQELDMTAQVVVHLDVSDAEVSRRLIARARSDGRSDDAPAVVARRLALYHEVTAPLLASYADRGILMTVDGAKPAAQLGTELLVALERARGRLDS